jgi:pimeloyl-ACP methyl ester carboxylesterase
MSANTQMKLSFFDSCGSVSQKGVPKGEPIGKPNGMSTVILFLNAFPLNQSMWDDQVAEFSPTHRVVTVDWPGFGESPATELEPGVGLTPYGLAVLRLLDHLKIDCAHVCGISMGGYVALELWRLAPHKFRSLILCDTRATSDSAAAREGRHELIASVRKNGTGALGAMMIPGLLGDSTRRESGSASIVERVRGMISTCSAEGVILAQLAMADRTDSSDLLSEIARRSVDSIGFKSLIIAGNEDKLTPPSEMMALARAISGAQFATIDDAGHLPNLEQPRAFNRILKEFLESR